VVDGDVVNDFYGAGHDGTDYALMADIRYAVDGTVGANQVPGRMIFYTATATGALTEAFRIDNFQQAKYALPVPQSYSIGATQTYTIPALYQQVLHEELINNGNVVNNGRLYVI